MEGPSSPLYGSQARTCALVDEHPGDVAGVTEQPGLQRDPHRPLHEYIGALNNGYEQDYHYADVLERGLDSPLLDLLNACYVVPADRPPESQPGL